MIPRKKRIATDHRKIPLTPEDLLVETKVNNETIERLIKQNKELEDERERLKKETEVLDHQLKYECRGKLHGPKCPRIIRLKDERDDTLRMYEAMKSRVDDWVRV